MTSFVQQHRLGEVYFAPVDVMLPQGIATPGQPDLVFIAREHLHIVKPARIEGAPDLIAEVLSPSNWLDDRRTKYEAYEAAGVPEYWIVDPDLRTVEVFELREHTYALLGRFGPGEQVVSHVLPGFEVAVDQILPQ